MKDKVEFSPDKRMWSPSVIPGPIMLVSTVDVDGVPNVAPKSWVQMVAFEPPTLMFAGTRGNPTENNIATTGCFGINIVSEDMLPTVLGCLRWQGTKRIEHCGWELVPGKEIAAPLVDQSPVHLECMLERTVSIGTSLVVFGRIVRTALDRTIAASDPAQRYDLLRQVCFLEDGAYAVLRNVIRC